MELRRRQNLLVLVALTCGLTYVYLHTDTHAHMQGKPGVFQPLTGHGYYTFHNLCIELDPDAKPITGQQNETPTIFGVLDRTLMGNSVIWPKRLVVYGAEDTEVKTIKPIAGPHVSSYTNNKWTIYFKESTLPSNKTHKLITEYPAYFVTTSCEGNLHHFLKDTAVGLFGALKETNRLNSTIPNQLYYSRPIWFLSRIPKCHHPGRFEDFLFAFSIRHHHDTYHMEEPNTCYQNAVFGFYRERSSLFPFLDDDEASPTYAQTTRYLSTYFGDAKSNCGEHPVITIIQRLHRTIANAEELKQYLIDSHVSSNVTIWILEHSTLQEQVQVIACTDILVGVEGAGLEWIHFMKKGKALLELAWPEKHWNFFYSSRAESIKLYSEELSAEKVNLNWTAFEKYGGLKGPLTEDRKKHFLTDPGVWYGDANPWKFADAFFNKVKFKEKILSLKRKINY